MSDNVINFATVTGVFSDGLALKFDGEDTATQKHYKCNAFVVFHVGDRVRVIEDSGTYVVEYPVGNPKTSFTADKAGSATNATNATTATNNYCNDSNRDRQHRDKLFRYTAKSNIF